MNDDLCLLLRFLNQSITVDVLRHWFRLDSCDISDTTLSRMDLLTRPSSLLAGLINLQAGLFRKSLLGSFNVTNAYFAASCWTRSSRLRDDAMAFTSLSMACLELLLVFLYDFVMFSCNSLLLPT